MRTLLILMVALAAGAALAQAPPPVEVHQDSEDRLLEQRLGDEIKPPSMGKTWTRDGDNWKINTDGTNQVQNEEQVAVNPLDPDNLVAVWRDFRLGYRRVGVGTSFDGGLTWTDRLLDSHYYTWHSDPGVTVDRFGNFYIVILSYEDTSSPNGLFVLKSTDGGSTWSYPVPAVNGVPGVFEDKELIACDRTGGPHDGNLYVAWARFYSTQIYCVRSIDGGQSFEPELRVSDSGGVQWPTPVVGADGTLYVAWVDYYADAIKLDRSTDGGQSFGSDLTVTSLYTAQTEINGGITVFGFPAMDADIGGGPYDGNLYLAYMSRQGGDFDIYFRRSTNGGTSWSSPIRLNDDAQENGRDQFHPWLAVSPDGVINVVFYDRRNDPSNYLMDLYFTQSYDGGATWTENQRVTTVSSNPNAGLRAGLIGEYIGLAASSASRVHAVWTDTRDGSQDVYTAVLGNGTGVAEEWAGGLRIEAILPNPSPGRTQIAYSAPSGQRVQASIFDVQGRRIRDLPATRGALWWDGRDGQGRELGNGVYLLRLSAGEEAATDRILLLR